MEYINTALLLFLIIRPYFKGVKTPLYIGKHKIKSYWGAKFIGWQFMVSWKDNARIYPYIGRRDNKYNCPHCHSKKSLVFDEQDIGLRMYDVFDCSNCGERIKQKNWDKGEYELIH